jgi:hypothetical protein
MFKNYRLTANFSKSTRTVPVSQLALSSSRYRDLTLPAGYLLKRSIMKL